MIPRQKNAGQKNRKEYVQSVSFCSLLFFLPGIFLPGHHPFLLSGALVALEAAHPLVFPFAGMTMCQLQSRHFLGQMTTQTVIASL